MSDEPFVFSCKKSIFSAGVWMFQGFICAFWKYNGYQKSAIRCITWCVVQCCGIKLDCCSGRNPESFHQRGIICIFRRDILLSAEYQYGISCGNIDLRASVIFNSIELMIVAYAPAYLYRKLPVCFLL